MIQNRIFKLSLVAIILLLVCNCCLCWRDSITDVLDDEIQRENGLSYLQDHIQKSLLDEHPDEDKQLDAWSFYNNPELGKHAEGDILIREEAGNVRRTFSKPDQIWFEGIVPVYIHSVILKNSHALNVLKNSMKTIQTETENCIVFRLIDDADIIKYPSLPYVNITGDEPSCFSDIGRSKKSIASQTNLNIYECFNMPGNSLHELMHILGQIHEHMRPDRDKYITIRWNNIRPDFEKNFEIRKAEDVATFNYPYDYDSITHYSRSSFSIRANELATIIPKLPNVEIGQRVRLSKIDIAKLLSAYKCQRPQPYYTLEQLADYYKNETIASATFADVVYDTQTSTAKSHVMQETKKNSKDSDKRWTVNNNNRDKNMKCNNADELNTKVIRVEKSVEDPLNNHQQSFTIYSLLNYKSKPYLDQVYIEKQTFPLPPEYSSLDQKIPFSNYQSRTNKQLVPNSVLVKRLAPTK